MKVLWFTNSPMPAVRKYLNKSSSGAGGGWMDALLDAIKDKRKDIQMGVACAYTAKKKVDLNIEGVRYYLVPQRKRLQRLEYDRILTDCARIVEEFKPDVIHIHGSEQLYGLMLVRNMIPKNIPVIISIQGFLSSYALWRSYFGCVHIVDLLKMNSIREFVTFRGVFWDWYNLGLKAKDERKIIQELEYVAGRTIWDEAWIRSINPKTIFFHIDELLRKPFFDKRWEISKCERHRIIYTNAGHPRRGTETLIEAITILKSEFPDIKLCLAGSVKKPGAYSSYILKKLQTLGDSLVLLGPLTGEEISEELIKSHIFTIASLIENSPNSLCEAQLLGVPAIASAVGGVSSLIDNERTGLMFPVNDAPVLAEQIRRVFLSDDLANKLSKNARAIATIRHNPENIIKQLTDCYCNILKNHNNG